MLRLMGLLRKIFWIAIFLISMFCFIVLFEKGTKDFVPNVKKQIEGFTKFLREQIDPPKTAPR